MPLTTPRRARWLRCAATLGVLVANAVASVPAAADEAADKLACARSYEQGQRLRRSQELRAARDELASCARAECPGSLRRECAQWLGEVDLAIPTIVVLARGHDGRPAGDARIRIDGEPVSEAAARAPIPLDPGVHLVRVDAPGSPEIEERIMLRSGEKNRRIEVTFGASPRPVFVAPVHEETARHEELAKDKPIPALVYVLGATGVLALGVGGYFQLDGMSKRSDLFQCAPRCAQGDVDRARTSLWVGNVTLGVGVAALVAATIVYFVRP